MQLYLLFQRVKKINPGYEKISNKQGLTQDLNQQDLRVRKCNAFFCHKISLIITVNCAYVHATQQRRADLNSISFVIV